MFTIPIARILTTHFRSSSGSNVEYLSFYTSFELPNTMGSGASVAARMNENSAIHYPNQLMYREITTTEGFIIQTDPDWTHKIDLLPRPSGSASSAEPHTFIAFYDAYQRSFSHGPTHSARTFSMFPLFRPGIPTHNQ